MRETHGIQGWSHQGQERHEWQEDGEICRRAGTWAGFPGRRNPRLAGKWEKGVTARIEDVRCATQMFLLSAKSYQRKLPLCGRELGAKLVARGTLRKAQSTYQIHQLKEKCHPPHWEGLRPLEGIPGV